MATSESRVGQMFGKYKIIGLLGKGGMGEVYEAQDTSKGRTVALKILAQQYSHDESFRTRFQRESRAAAILQEPHVIPIHDWGEIDGNLYIDMRLVKGQTLQDLLEHGPIEPARAVDLISQVGSALDAAHAAGLIHRDVKPQNIIVTSTDFPYLVDFGIAEAKGDTGLTMTGTYVGTVNYMAPERFSGRGGATSAVDVYSLACVLYECLTGKSPFPGNSLEAAMVAHLSTPPPSVSAANWRVPPSFDAVIARGMAKEPDDRYGSAGALGRAAKRALEGGQASTGGQTVQNYGASPPTVMGAPHTMGPPAHTMGQTPETMAAEQYTMRAPVGHQPAQYAAPYMGPPHGQYSAPPPATPPPPPATPAPAPAPAPKAWIVPTVVAISAVLVLGAIGVVIVTQTTKEDDGGGTASQTSSLTPVTTQTTTQPRPQTSEQSSPPGPPPPNGTPPPLVTGPDLSGAHEQCDYGYVRKVETGFGSRSGRGTPETSCHFAGNVLDAYWSQFGRPTAEARVVSAPGAVPCNTVLTDGKGCDGSNFLMQCQEGPGQNFITCTGGRNARVYIF